MVTTKNLFSSFEPKTKKDWEKLVLNDLALLHYVSNGIKTDAYVTAEDNYNKAELIHFNQLMQKSNVQTTLLFEHPTYKTIPVAANTSLVDTIVLFLESIRKVEDIPFYAFELTLDHQYLFQIARIRAIRVLMLRLWPCLESNPNLIIPVFTKINFDQSISEHQNMIPITYQLMVAMASNVNGIILGDSFKHSLNRLIQNAHQILVHESDMYSLKDPAGGSYFIDQLTSKLVDEAWEKLLQIYPFSN